MHHGQAALLEDNKLYRWLERDLQTGKGSQIVLWEQRSTWLSY